MAAISIIVPSFNEEPHIARCLDSIINQTFSDFEVICVDDNSTDSTFEIIQNYSKKDPRIKAYKNPSKGVSSARNFGIENSSGKYLGFVDSDDFIQPQMYEFLLRSVTENNCSLAACRYEKTSEPESKSFGYNCRECFSSEFVSFSDMDFVEKNELVFTSACMKLIEKKLVTSDNLFKGYRIGEDTVFCAELWNKCEKVFWLTLPLYCYYTNTQSVSYTKIYDEKWLDLLKTRFITYNILKEKDSRTASFYLDRGMKFILSYRFNIKGTPGSKNKKDLNKYFKKYIMHYLKCKNISVKYKASVLIFYFIPPLYSAFRKMQDSTI